MDQNVRVEYHLVDWPKIHVNFLKLNSTQVYITRNLVTPSNLHFKYGKKKSRIIEINYYLVVM